MGLGCNDGEFGEIAGKSLAVTRDQRDAEHGGVRPDEEIGDNGGAVTAANDIKAAGVTRATRNSIGEWYNCEIPTRQPSDRSFGIWGGVEFGKDYVVDDDPATRDCSTDATKSVCVAW